MWFAPSTTYRVLSTLAARATRSSLIHAEPASEPTAGLPELDAGDLSDVDRGPDREGVDDAPRGFPVPDRELAHLSDEAGAGRLGAMAEHLVQAFELGEVGVEVIEQERVEDLSE